MFSSNSIHCAIFHVRFSLEDEMLFVHLSDVHKIYRRPTCTFGHGICPLCHRKTLLGIIYIFNRISMIILCAENRWKINFPADVCRNVRPQQMFYVIIQGRASDFSAQFIAFIMQTNLGFSRRSTMNIHEIRFSLKERFHLPQPECAVQGFLLGYTRQYIQKSYIEFRNYAKSMEKCR